MGIIQVSQKVRRSGVLFEYDVVGCHPVASGGTEPQGYEGLRQPIPPVCARVACHVMTECRFDDTNYTL